MKDIVSISSEDAPSEEPNAVRRTVRHYRSDKVDDVTPYAERLSHSEMTERHVDKSVAKLLHRSDVHLARDASNWTSTVKELANKLSKRHTPGKALGVTDFTAWPFAVVLMRSYEKDFQNVAERSRSGDQGRYLNNPVAITSTLESIKFATGLGVEASRRLLEHLNTLEREDKLFANHLDHELTALLNSLYGKKCDAANCLQRLIADLRPIRYMFADFRGKVPDAKNLRDRGKDLSRLERNEPGRFREIAEAEIYGSANLQSSLESLPNDLNRKRVVASWLDWFQRNQS
jgi:hypothetical protein